MLNNSDIFPFNPLTPQPRGSIQFSTPSKHRSSTPKVNATQPMATIGFPPVSRRPQVLFSSNSNRYLTVQHPSDSMVQSQIMGRNDQGLDVQGLQFRSNDKASTSSARKRNSTQNDLSRFLSGLILHKDSPNCSQDEYSLKVTSTPTISNAEQNLFMNPEFRLSFNKQRIQKSYKSCRSPKSNFHSLSDFIVGKKLGKGNFGEVYMSKHQETGFLFALKIIPKRKIVEAKMEKRILWEATIQMTLSHPNITAMYGMFDDKQNVYFIQQLMIHGHLFDHIKQRKRLTEEQTIPIVRNIAEALDYMHRKSIIHRDLKPQNVFMHMGTQKIGDFGWAVYTPNSLRDTFCGTPLYMSPQILKGDQYDQTVDNWALGILTYELLVGRPPFKIRSSEQLNKIVTQQVSFPQYVSLSDSSKNFILQLLHKDPDNRNSLDILLLHPFLKASVCESLQLKEAACLLHPSL